MPNRKTPTGKNAAPGAIANPKMDREPEQNGDQSSGPANSAATFSTSSAPKQQHVKIEMLPSALLKSGTDLKSASQKLKHSDPPKVIMLPDSLQTGTKRRRVVRACDRCRKLKIKCSGDLPCIHCTVYNYECTYDQPNKSKKKPNLGGTPETPNTISMKKSSVSNPKVNFKSVNTFLTTNRDRSSSKSNPGSNIASTSMEKFNSSTVSILASSNPELFSKLTDRLKLYDDILHRLLPEIKLTDLNDNPKPINPMKLMSALNKLRDMGKSISKSSSKQIAKMYDSLPEMPLPNLPITKLPPNFQTQNIQNRAQPNQSNQSQFNGNKQPSPLLNNYQNNNNTNSNTTVNNNATNNYQHPDLNNSPYQGIDGSLESSMGKEIKIILPSREVALDLITKTWENACVLFRFYHRVAFIEDLNELYDTDPNHYTNRQQRFLPLVYSVMACGALFYKSDENTNFSKLGYDLYNKDNNNNNKNDITADSSSSNTPVNNDFIQRKDFEDEGYKYFIAARKLIDITDTRDTYGIQTIVMLIIFLQCSARLSTCYAYIGIALRAALREGLHRKLDYPFNPIELEIRKRLFWTIYKMDIYVNTMLGLPRTISSDDFDQDMPIELDDENITVNGYRFDRQGDRLSSSGIANAHTRLIFIMKEVVTKLYPIKPKKLVTNNSNSNKNHSATKDFNHVSNTDLNNTDNNKNGGNVANANFESTNQTENTLNSSSSGNKSNVNNNTNNANSRKKTDLMRDNFVYDLELKLQDWMNSLPLELKPGVEPPGQYLKANRLLHISYLHVKIILYRPFIHYISANLRFNSLNDLACIEKAKNCINVARIVVKLAEDMINKNMLSGSYWFSIYTIFFSVACLVYYVHFAPSLTRDGEPDAEYIAIKKDAENGKRVLDILKDSSMAARRTYNILNALFEQLNRKTARAGNNNNPQFVPAHMGTSEYVEKQRQQQQQQQQQQKQMFQRQQYNYMQQQQQQQQQQHPALSAPLAPAQRQSNQMKSPEGYSSLENQYMLNASNHVPNRYTEGTINTSKTESFPGLTPSNLSPINIPSNEAKSTTNRVGSILSNQGVKLDSVSSFENLSPMVDFNNQFNIDSNDRNSTSSDLNGGINDITDYKYVPGPMDQMDMKIFGRFLPPYMLNNSTNSNNNATNSSINSVDYNPGNTGVSKSGDVKFKPANKEIKQEEVFQPSMGLFSFVKTNEDYEAETDDERRDAFISIKNDANEEAVRPTQEGREGNKAGSKAIVGKKNEKVTAGQGSKLVQEDWIDDELLASTNDFFNKVTNANAIPSGLSTVFQSENDKNEDGQGVVLPGVDHPNGGNHKGGVTVNTDNKNSNLSEGNRTLHVGDNLSQSVDKTVGRSEEDDGGTKTIELPSRFTSIEGIGMLDELLFGSGWDTANENSGAKGVTRDEDPTTTDESL